MLRCVVVCCVVCRDDLQFVVFFPCAYSYDEYCSRYCSLCWSLFLLLAVSLVLA